MTIEPATSLYRGRSFLQLQNLEFVQGQRIGGKPGIRVPIPNSSMPDGELVQVVAYVDDQLSATNLDAADVRGVVLTIARRGKGFIMENMPLSRLVMGKKGGKQRYVPLFEPSRIDARRSYLLITDPAVLTFNAYLEFIYA